MVTDAGGVGSRAAGLTLAVLALLVVMASPAAAHGRGSDVTNYRSVVTDAPDVSGLEWRVYGGDELLHVRNLTTEEIVVEGYAGEPYLRIGPRGVFENRLSPATYVNQDRYALVEPPPEADPAADPEWVLVSTSNAYGWHDHRIHWMALEPPPAVEEAGRGVETVVYDRWEVPFTVGGEPMIVAGELRWVPGPSPWPWLAVGLLLSLPALVGLRTSPVPAAHGRDAPDVREGQDDTTGGPAGWVPPRWPGAARPAAAVLAVVVLANMTHLIDDLFAVPVPAGQVAVAAGQTLLFLAIAIFGVVRGWQAGDGAFTAIGVGAGAMLVGQGILYAGLLSASQTASIFPGALTRIAVALSIAHAVPVGIVVFLGTRRLLPPLEETGTPAAPPAPPAGAEG